MTRKLLLSIVAFATFFTTGAIAKSKHMMYQAVPVYKAQILQSGKNKAYCSNCGMTLHMFYKTNHAATVNGKIKQYCSMHCLAQDIVQGLHPTNIKVVDNTTLKFIPVKNAYYVVGSKKPATMSKISKYAFGTKKAALKFAKKFGGKVMRFKKAIMLVEKAFKKETMMVSKMQHMMAKKGKMMFSKRCKATNLPKFSSIAKAKEYIAKNNICGKIKGKHLQAVGLYLYYRK
jgi:nitrous oxide reductase accessory protein NosL